MGCNAANVPKKYCPYISVASELSPVITRKAAADPTLYMNQVRRSEDQGRRYEALRYRWHAHDSHED